MKKIPCFPKPKYFPSSQGDILGKLQQSSLYVAELQISFQRTCRVPQGKINSLPASLGSFPLYQVRDFKQGVPKEWQEDAYFFPMYKQEAMWISFGRGRNEQPKALIIGAGNINAISGKPFDPSKDKLSGKKKKSKGLDIRLEQEQNYLVVPPQPWIDGWKAEDGKVYQFVAAEMGSGETVEGQITGEETIGGLQFILYNPLPGQNLINETRPHEYISGGSWGSDDYDEHPVSYGKLMCSSNALNLTHTLSHYKNVSYGKLMCSSHAPQLRARSGASVMYAAQRSMQAMGLGRGGEISQKIYPDPHGIGVWNPEPRAVSRLYLVSSADFKQITGHAAPPTPVTYEKYQQLGLPWFDLYDEKLEDTSGSSVFEKLKPVSGGITIAKKKTSPHEQPPKELLEKIFEKFK